MKNVRRIFYSLILKMAVLPVLILVGVSVAVGQDFPAVSKTLVTDYTNTLTSSEVQALERKLVAFDDSTSTQIAVVLVNSTDGYDIADYAVRLAQKWGVGNKKYNNGVMVLAAIGDRAITIQTGYGIEGALPDAIAYRIIENDIKPAFRSGDYYTGLNNATSSIISYTKGEYKAEPKASSESEGGRVGGVVVIIIIFILISLISKGGGRNKGRRVIDGKGSSDLFWWMLLSGLGRGGSDRDDGGFGGGFGGGGGGGFGGFGGGGFGGGGASGRW